MTNRLLFALCITVCVGMFTAPRSGDADEVQNRKNDENSNALAKVLQAQENHRGQVQSNQLELILVLDEAIPLIEGDINEFKTFEVRAGGGPRVFKTLKEKEEMIQSLEQVRDGWKARITGHEAILSACATRPIWNCQIPIQNLTQGSIGQIHKDFDNHDQDFLEGLKLFLQGKHWTPEMMPPKKAAVSSPKAQTTKTQPPKTPKPTQQNPKRQPGPAARPLTSNNPGRMLLGPGESMDQDGMATGGLPDEKLALYQRVYSDPFHVDFPQFKPWECKVISVADEHNVIVSLSIPAPAAEIKDLILLKVRLEDYYERKQKRMALETRVECELAIGNVKTKIAELSAPKSQLLWIRGVSTKRMMDDKPVELAQTLIIVGTESYQTAAGARLTIPRAEAINLDELKTLAAKRPTADEYGGSKEFSAIQRTREVTSAERLKRQNEMAATKREADEKKAAASNEAARVKREADEKKADVQLASAKTFMDKMNPKAARFTLEQLIKQYPDSSARKEADELLMKMLGTVERQKTDSVEKRVEMIEQAEAKLALAEKFIEKMNHKAARSTLEQLIKQFPETIARDEAEKLLKTLPE